MDFKSKADERVEALITMLNAGRIDANKSENNDEADFLDKQSKSASIKNKNIEILNERDLLLNQQLQDNNAGRLFMRDWTTAIVTIWMTLVLLLIVCVGQGKCKLSDSVLITLLSTTSINLIGLVLIVLKDLFPKN